MEPGYREGRYGGPSECESVEGFSSPGRQMQDDVWKRKNAVHGESENYLSFIQLRLRHTLVCSRQGEMPAIH